MGELLARYYAFAETQGGFTLQLKLAMITRMAEPAALAAPDTPELREKFHAALKEILGNNTEIPRY